MLILGCWLIGTWEDTFNPTTHRLLEIVPLEFHRRQLHRLQYSTGHVRSRYGGTISVGCAIRLTQMGSNTQGRLA